MILHVSLNYKKKLAFIDKEQYETQQASCLSDQQFYSVLANHDFASKLKGNSRRSMEGQRSNYDSICK